MQVVIDIIRSSELVMGTADVSGVPTSELGVPQELRDAYESSPNPMIELLLAMATFGSAEESLKAVAYAEALLFDATMASHLVAYVGREEEFIEQDSDGFSVRDAYLRNITNKLKR